ncbi:a18f397d-680c-41c7-80c9-42ac4638b89e [Thermothielavioides terrestris]|uniref:A18f397d-680c-41c7-80c9-42ac4638b89e n=1 Tax=Thermothielavioides terrestris TaxID=2587410 RepID=A0A446BQ82_9PEZI|nr:a18f397d-680c-41c7-80c9-42ac4638b89e [Thermothielavioides terrestris]
MSSTPQTSPSPGAATSSGPIVTVTDTFNTTTLANPELPRITVSVATSAGGTQDPKCGPSISAAAARNADKLSVTTAIYGIKTHGSSVGVGQQGAERDFKAMRVSG